MDGAGLSRFNASQSDPHGLSREEAFWNSLGHGPTTVEPWSVPAFLPGKASVGPRSFGEVALSPASSRKGEMSQSCRSLEAQLEASRSLLPREGEK